MHIPLHLRRDLTALSEALNDPDLDLAALVADFARTVSRAVRSYVGLTIMITVDGQDADLTLLDDSAASPVAETSLYLPATPPVNKAATVPTAMVPRWTVTGIVVYASVPGALVDLAADASWLSVNGGIELDRHLPLVASSASLGLNDLSMVNQAIGVLMAGGCSPEEAGAELRRLASAAETPEADAARLILAALPEPPP